VVNSLAIDDDLSMSKIIQHRNKGEEWSIKENLERDGHTLFYDNIQTFYWGD
jgi:hypothetical protein